MNTVEKGDLFEEKSHQVILDAIDNGLLGIHRDFARVFKKKKYYSPKRGKKIIFDLSIEIWPPNAPNYSVVYIVECKDYSSKKVPIGDIELFASRVDTVAELNGKAVFITSSSYPEPAKDFAKATGMMLIEVDENNAPEIILYKKEGREEQELDSLLSDFFKAAFSPKKIEGLKILSKEDISQITTNIYDYIDINANKDSKCILLDKIIYYFETKHGLQFDFGYDLFKMFGQTILGCFDSNKNNIFIDKSLLGTSRFSFVLAHEIGHFMLHNRLTMNQEVYNNFQDSEYDLFADKHSFKNDKNWIEWQANSFAANLLMPEKTFIARLQAYRQYLGISKYQRIYLDNQPQNLLDFDNTLKYLSKYFGTSKTSVEYRINELGLITRGVPENTYRDSLRNVLG